MRDLYVRSGGRALFVLGLAGCFGEGPTKTEDTTVQTAEDVPLVIDLSAQRPAGSTYTYAVVEQPASGTVSDFRSGQILYTPGADYVGTDTFTWELRSETAAVSDPARVTIDVTPVNDVPVATDLAGLEVEPGKPLVLTLPATDVDGDALTCALGATTPLQGTLVIDECAAVYTPTGSGTDTFTFTASDAVSTSAEATVTLVVGEEDPGENQAPTAEDMSVSLDEDTTTDIVLTGSDPDDDALTWRIESPPRFGELSLDGNVATYVPAADASGSDAFRFTVTDEHGLSSEPADVQIEVLPTEDPPVGTPTTYELLEDETITVPFPVVDPEGDRNLAIEIIAAPANGVASVSGQDLVFTPNANWSGNDRMRFLATDRGGNVSEPTVLTLAVSAVNDPPLVTDLAVETPEDTTVTMSVLATDVEGDALTYAVATPPTHGTATLSGTDLTYTPDPDYEGSDELVWSVSDGTDTVYGTASLTITPVDDGVIVSGAALTTAEDEPVDHELLVTNKVGTGPYTYALSASPTHGDVLFTGDTLTYTPDQDYYGADSFSVQATDAMGNRSSPGRFTVTVSAVNDAPVATSTRVTGNEDTPVTFTLGLADVDGDATVTIVTGPANGTASRSGASVTYTPSADWSGEDSLTWYASDASSTTPVATVSLSVAAVNDVPEVEDLAVTAEEDTTTVLTLPASDVEDGTNLTYVVSAHPAHGDVTVDGGVATYVPDAEWSGADSFRWYAVDPQGGYSELATVSLTYAAVNDPPTPTLTEIACDENSYVEFTLTATDPEGDALTYSVPVSGRPANGSTRVTGADVRYTPTTDWDGTDTLTYAVTDGTSSVSGTVTITVRNTNGSVEASSTNARGPEDEPLVFDLAIVDPDGDDITVTVTTNPDYGSVTLDGITATYVPDADFSGEDSFRVRAVDTDGYAASANVYVTIEPINDAPVSANQSSSCDEDDNVSFRLEATDVDSDGSLEYVIDVAPTRGSVSQQGGRITYTPDDNYEGTDSLVWHATDGELDSAQATVSITVNGLIDPPEVAPATVHTWMDEPVAVVLEVDDPDSETVTIAFNETVSHGTLDEVDGGYVYTPEPGFIGRDFFSFTATDEATTSAEVRYTIAVGPPTLHNRADMPQIGVNKVLFGLNAAISSQLDTATYPYRPDDIFDIEDQLGVQIHRQLQNWDLGWTQVEPSQDRFLDGSDNEAIPHDTIETTVTLFEIQYASPTPPWCTDHADFQAELGEDAIDYLDYVIANYGADVNSWEIGNEMFHWVAADPDRRDDASEDLPDCYPDDGYSPEEQAGFIYDAANYIRDADGDAVITLASINSDSTSSSDWLDGVIATVPDTDFFDILSIHAYDSWARLFNTRDELLVTMDDLGIGDKIIRLTEMGSTSDADNTNRTNYPNSDESQCADIFRLSMVALGGGVSSAIWHTLAPISSVGSGQEFSGFELIEYDGSWKPSAYAYQLFAEELLPMQQATEYQNADRWVYKVHRTDGEVRWVMWGERGIAAPEGATEYTSVYPNSDGTYTWLPLPEPARFNLTETPILLR